VRRGELALPEGRMAFALLGEGGQYDREQDLVYFDKDGDGRFDFDDRRSPERYQVKERWVNLGASTYGFRVDPAGRTLTLERRPVPLPDRESVAVGAPAPGFEERDLAGEVRSLASLRGKVVLLDFWSMGCAPCVGEIPDLVAAWQRFHAAGFEILGVNAGDPRDALVPFLERQGVVWPQLPQTGFDDELFRRYRVQALPTYVLVGPDGTIVATELRGPDLEQELERRLGDGGGAGG